MSAGAWRQVGRDLSATECARVAWRLVLAAPGMHFGAGMLFLLIVSVFPLLLQGPMWVGLCAMALAALRGETVSLEQFFAPFGDKRAGAAWRYGLLLTVIMVGSQLVGVSMLAGAMFSAMSGVRSGGMAQQLFTLEVMASFLVMLLPYLFMAYWLFPVGFYIANGETDFGTAMRHGFKEVNRRRVFWSSFWGAMMLGHLIGMLTCCIGIAFVLPWNCIAMGAGLMAQDPELGTPLSRSRTTVPNLPPR